MSSVRDEPPFEIIDLRVTFRIDCFWDEIVNPRYQYILVVRAVENHDLAALGGRLFYPPQKIVSEFHRRRLLEAGDAAALWIHRAEDMPDHAILAARVECLKAN